MRLLLQFFKAFSEDWLAKMSGPPTVPLTIAAFFVPNRLLKILLGTLAVLCAVVASYRVWAKEHMKLEIAKQGRPVLTASFLPLGAAPPQVMLRLQNSSSCPAVGIHVADIRFGTKVLRFFPPEALANGASQCIHCQILESGWKQQDDVTALFDVGDSAVKILVGRTTSGILRLSVTYSNLDSRTSQKDWVLSCDFWYDYQQHRIFSGTQFLEPRT
jgi:hypothetical protein